MRQQNPATRPKQSKGQSKEDKGQSKAQQERANTDQGGEPDQGDELRRERGLVRSAGTIPKRVMAVAFGLLSIGWAIYATLRPTRRNASSRS